MPKPDWTQPEKKGFLTDTPNLPENAKEECFVVYQTWGQGQQWWCGWKNYARLWTALRFGMMINYNKDHMAYVMNTKTNEIVWRSWEDENPYRGG